MAVSGTIVLLLLGLLIGSGVGFSYANSIFSATAESLQDEMNQLDVLFGESEKRVESLASELGEANGNLESEKGKVSALSVELDRTNVVLRSLERELASRSEELSLERQLVTSLERGLALSEDILNEVARNYSLPSEAQTKYFDAREAARDVDFNRAVLELREARKMFASLKEGLILRTQHLSDLSEMSAKEIVAKNYTSAFSLGVQATISRVDALLLLYTVLEEFEALEFRPGVADRDRWQNLLDQSELLIDRGESFLDEARSYSPELVYLKLETTALQEVLNEIVSFREFSDL